MRESAIGGGPAPFFLVTIILVFGFWLGFRVVVVCCFGVVFRGFEIVGGGLGYGIKKRAFLGLFWGLLESGCGVS